MENSVISLLRDMSRLLKPESLSKVLEYSDKMDWEALAESHGMCLDKKWELWFDEWEGLHLKPEWLKEILTTFLKTMDIICDCSTGEAMICDLDKQGFFQHCETCFSCSITMSYMGWYSLVLALEQNLEEVEQQQASVIDGKPSNEEVLLTLTGLKVVKDDSGRISDFFPSEQLPKLKLNQYSCI